MILDNLPTKLKVLSLAVLAGVAMAIGLGVMIGWDRLKRIPLRRLTGPEHILSNLKFKPIPTKIKGRQTKVRFYNLAENPIEAVASVIIGEAVVNERSGPWQEDQPGEAESLAEILGSLGIYQYEPGIWMFESEWQLAQAHNDLVRKVELALANFTHATGVPVREIRPRLVFEKTTGDDENYELQMEIITGDPVSGDLPYEDVTETEVLASGRGTWTCWRRNITTYPDPGADLTIKEACEQLADRLIATLGEYMQITRRTIEAFQPYVALDRPDNISYFEYVGLDVEQGLAIWEVAELSQNHANTIIKGEQDVVYHR